MAAATRKRKKRALVPPAPLRDGCSLADLPDREVGRRASFVAQVYDFLCTEVKRFVAAGCPVEDEEQLLAAITGGLKLSIVTLGDAAEWRELRSDAIRETFASLRAMTTPPKRLPALAMAAFWCDVALAAEEDFWGAIRARSRKLREGEVRAKEWRRSRAH